MGKYINMPQTAAIVKVHLYVALTATFAGIILPVALEGAFGYVFSMVFMLIYALAMYNKSEEIARHDGKSYSDGHVHPCKGLVLPVGVAAVWLVLLALYLFSWKYDIVSYGSGFINNIMFAVWGFVYNGFMRLDNGSFNWFSLVLAILLPTAACGAGYFAGYKGFDLSKKVAGLVYEKQEPKED